MKTEWTLQEIIKDALDSMPNNVINTEYVSKVVTERVESWQEQKTENYIENMKKIGMQQLIDELSVPADMISPSPSIRPFNPYKDPRVVTDNKLIDVTKDGDENNTYITGQLKDHYDKES